jgi:hypothetical protein
MWMANCGQTVYQYRQNNQDMIQYWADLIQPGNSSIAQLDSNHLEIDQ